MSQRAIEPCEVCTSFGFGRSHSVFTGKQDGNDVALLCAVSHVMNPLLRRCERVELLALKRNRSPDLGPVNTLMREAREFGLSSIEASMTLGV
jgi:hypothetical protein